MRIRGIGIATGLVALLVCLVAPMAAGGALLHDQNDNPGMNGVISQNDSNDANDTFLADDFIVPVGGWTIQRVDVSGSYDSTGQGPVPSLNVFIHTDQAGFPFDPAANARLNVVPANGTAGPNFILNLTPAVTLPAGIYWLSVQANYGPYSDNIWDWRNRTVQSNAGAAFKNPGGGLGLPCAVAGWIARSACPSIAFAGQPDQMFALHDAPFVSPPPGGGGGAAAPIPTTATPPKKCKKGQKLKKGKCVKKKRKKRK
jgi:hypothetical protein